MHAVRSRFSSLRDDGFVFLDAPGGSQVPDEVGDAIARTLREASANIGANYETSKRVERILDTAREDGARFLGCSSDDVIFGTNMTWLDFALSRTASRDSPRPKNAGAEPMPPKLPQPRITRVTRSPVSPR